MRIALFFCATAASCLAQTAAPPKAPTFDVASVRPTAPGQPGITPRRGANGGFINPFRRDDIKVTPDSVIIHSTSLKAIIAWAFAAKEYQISGPDWLDTTRFDISAKSGDETTEDRMRLMMQGLLADRLKLAYHRANKETQCYALVIGKNGSKLVESTSEGESEVNPDQSRMQITFLRTPLSALTDLLYLFLRTPVVDETGLNGKYDLTVNAMKYMSMANDSGPMDPVSLIMTAVQEELGLKLESRKVSLDMLVIDHVEKSAGEN